LRCTNFVLPLVFDDSLSYAEQIAKLQAALKALSEFVDGSIDEYLSQWVAENFNELMIKASYNETSESIILAKGGENK
jgi:hypothetical protein